ncbi:MAG: hypothetical protein IBX50_11120 [Marinospirillum sp.]|uniref:hypothetical protein n=1 Tax=Marinospirillum sp. TaxID=2183934 RepID=UPI0019EA918A|nr:hypothetical protein [Marinospirillum sp.]MBE0507254.1 hypothetical protein [Marinospirillum sp.]
MPHLSAVGIFGLQAGEDVKKIVDSKATEEAVLKELEVLQKRRDAALQILGKDINTLFEKQFVAEQDVQSLASYVSQIEFRMALRKSAHG